MHLVCIVGARPNFMKIAPILRALEAYSDVRTTLIHTGQHYDKNLSQIFFDELEIKAPDIYLGVGSGTHAKQTADVMMAVEKELMRFADVGEPVDRLIVVGDVNSTMAASVAAVKLNIPVAHIEAGLRSFDREMPEEINRLLTDSIADMLLVSEPSGLENLKNEGQPDSNVHLVGNVMIDTLLHQVEKAKASKLLNDIGVKRHGYCVVTLHRPSNVDDKDVLSGLIDVLIEISRQLPIVFPVHPRTDSKLSEFGLGQRLRSSDAITLLEPLGYLDFLSLTSNSKVIVTDSGGLQEESTALLVPCLTMRDSTERPITVSTGTSTLIGNDAELLHRYLQQVIDGEYKDGVCPELWDGKAAERIARILTKSVHQAESVLT